MRVNCEMIRRGWRVRIVDMPRVRGVVRETRGDGTVVVLWDAGDVEIVPRCYLRPTKRGVITRAGADKVATVRPRRHEKARIALDLGRFGGPQRGFVANRS